MWIFPLLGMAAAATLTCQPAFQPEVGAIAITVGDLERSIAFMTHTLDFELESRSRSEGERLERTLGVFGAVIESAMLRLGDERIELIDFLTPGGRDVPADSRSNDGWFQHVAIVVADMEAAVARLRESRVTLVSAGPQRLPDWNAGAGGIEACYFKDPDGHVLEIIHYPEGRGDPKWHRPAAEHSAGGGLARMPVFLGIDHTAIVTSDTERSVAFYSGVLGLRPAGQGENYGIEQERLNNLFGAHLRITTLRGSDGPGIELLEYLTPATGRAFPRDTRADDLWHWHVVLTGPADLRRAVESARAVRVSAAPASPDRPLPDVLVRDPDGHALLLAPQRPARQRTDGEP